MGTLVYSHTQNEWAKIIYFNRILISKEWILYPNKVSPNPKIPGIKNHSTTWAIWLLEFTPSHFIKQWMQGGHRPRVCVMIPPFIYAVLHVKIQEDGVGGSVKPHFDCAAHVQWALSDHWHVSADFAGYATAGGAAQFWEPRSEFHYHLPPFPMLLNLAEDMGIGRATGSNSIHHMPPSHLWSCTKASVPAKDKLTSWWAQKTHSTCTTQPNWGEKAGEEGEWLPPAPSSWICPWIKAIK